MKYLMFLAIIFSCSASAKTDCHKFGELAYKLQLDRQHGIYHQENLSTDMMADMYNSIWQRPRRIDKKAAARRFAGEWYRACVSGMYK
jgi:hypothetical protein